MIFMEVVKEAGMRRHLNILPLSLSNFIFTFFYCSLSDFFTKTCCLVKMPKFSVNCTKRKTRSFDQELSQGGGKINNQKCLPRSPLQGTLRRMVKYPWGVNFVQPTVPFDIVMAVIDWILSFMFIFLGRPHTQLEREWFPRQNETFTDMCETSNN